MNRKVLSTTVIFLIAIMTVPLAQARDSRGDHRRGPDYRETHVEQHNYHTGQPRGWHMPRYPRHPLHSHYRYYNHYRASAPRHHHPGHY